MVQPLWKTVRTLLKKLKIELPYDPAIPLVGIYPKEMEAGPGKDICTPVFIAALFTTARRWKEPSAPSVNEQVKKLGYVQSVEYYSATRKKGILPSATTRRNPEGIMLSEISQTEKDKYCMTLLIYRT